MYTYSLPVRRCQQLEKADRVKEQTHVTSAGTFYVVRDYIEKADLIIEQKLTNLQYKLKEDFSKLLVTRDMFLMHNRALEARFQTINENW